MSKAATRLTTSGVGDRSPGDDRSRQTRFAPVDAKLAEAYRDFEDDISSLECMAEVVANTIEGLLADDPTPITGRREFYYITKDQANIGLFTVYHLLKMIREANEKYFAGFEDPSEQQEGRLS
jgi:hypothetical protein